LAGGAEAIIKARGSEVSTDWGIFERDEPYQVHVVPMEDSQ
jgi:hypothetical protein